MQQFQDQTASYTSQLEYTAEEAVVHNELNKLENDLLKKNRREKQTLFERTFDSAIHAYRQSIDSLPDEVQHIVSKYIE